MSIPAPSSVTEQSGLTSPVTGQIHYGWISDAWRLFSAQMGVWIAATAVLAAPSIIFAVMLYAMMWSTMFPTGFPPAAYNPSVPTPPGSNGFPAPLTPGASLNSHMTQIYTLEIGYGLLYALWSAFLYGGMFRMSVRQVRGLPIEMRDIVRGGPLFGRMLGAIFLLGFGGYFLEALCIGPLYLLIWKHGPLAATIVAGVVGVALLIALSLSFTGMLLPSFALIADGDKVISALKRSMEAMKGRWAASAGFVFVLGLLVYASALPCYVGLLATTPMIFLVCALAYRDMVGMPNMVPPPAPHYPAADAGTWPPPPNAAPDAWPPQPQWGSGEPPTDRKR